MGLFSHPCENTDCSARIKRGAGFCTRCGWAGPKSLIPCPNCHKQVGGGNKYCWNCGSDIQKEPPPRIIGGRWIRDEEEFAVRVDAADVEGFLSKRVKVEPGTSGVVERSNTVISNEEWGEHTLDHVFKIHEPNAIILISNADAVIRPTFYNLRDANGAEFNLTMHLVFRVSDYDVFTRQFFEGHKRRVTYRSIEERFFHEHKDVVRGLVCANTMEDMYGNLQWRDEFEGKIRDAMTVTLNRYGLELLQLSFVDFGGDHFEELQEDRGVVYMGNHGNDHLAEMVAIRKLELELKAQEEGNKFATEKIKQDRRDDLASEYGLKKIIRDSERVEIQSQALHELELRDKLRTFESEDLEGERKTRQEDEQTAREQMLEKIGVEHQNEIAMTILIERQNRDATESDFEREQQRLKNTGLLAQEWELSEQDRKNDRAYAAQRYELIVQESRANLDAAKNTVAQRLEEMKVDKASKSLDREDQRERVRIMGEMQKKEIEMMEAEARLGLEEKKLDLDLERFKVEQGTSVELAKVKGNVDIATVQSGSEKATLDERARQLEARLDDQKANTETARSDADTRSADMIKMASVVSGNQASSTAATSGQSGTAGAATEESPCPGCQRPVAHSANNCPWCGHGMRG